MRLNYNVCVGVWVYICVHGYFVSVTIKYYDTEIINKFRAGASLHVSYEIHSEINYIDSYKIYIFIRDK